MVYTLSRDEVHKVCNDCPRFVSYREACRTDENPEPKLLVELRRCDKWDKYFGGSCLFRG